LVCWSDPGNPSLCFTLHCQTSSSDTTCPSLSNFLIIRFCGC
jgi:hypothetical protein